MTWDLINWEFVSFAHSQVCFHWVSVERFNQSLFVVLFSFLLSGFFFCTRQTQLKISTRRHLFRPLFFRIAISAFCFDFLGVRESLHLLSSTFLIVFLRFAAFRLLFARWWPAFFFSSSLACLMPLLFLCASCAKSSTSDCRFAGYLLYIFSPIVREPHASRIVEWRGNVFFFWRLGFFFSTFFTASPIGLYLMGDIMCQWLVDSTVESHSVWEF